MFEHLHFFDWRMLAFEMLCRDRDREPPDPYINVEVRVTDDTVCDDLRRHS